MPQFASDNNAGIAPFVGVLIAQDLAVMPMMLVIGALFFFLLILPERKKQKQRTQMLEALKKGDRVMTTGGLYGTVVTTTSEVVVLQVADNVRMRFTRAAVQTIVEAEKEAALEEKAEPSKA